jgi:putative oxidoreductase
MPIKKLHSSTLWNVDFAGLVLRVFMGGFMAYAHGWGKFVRWDEIKLDFATPFGMPDMLSAGLTVFAEFFCGILVAIGLFTRFAAIPVIITMAVAAFVIHGGDPLEDREGALTYLAAFTTILFLGSGKFSLDYILFKRKDRKVVQ